MISDDPSIQFCGRIRRQFLFVQMITLKKLLAIEQVEKLRICAG